MMKLTTQDGRTIELSHKYHLFISGGVQVAGKLEGKKAKITVTTFTKKFVHPRQSGEIYETGGEVVKRYGVIAQYDTTTGFYKAIEALQKAWDSNASSFTMPQDTFEKSEAEKFEDICEEYGLMCVSVNELGYKPSDIPRNKRIWLTTNEFEKHGILVADENASMKDFGGVYSTSFKKWQALHRGEKKTA